MCLGGSLAGSVSVWHSPGYRIACVSEGMRERERETETVREREKEEKMRYGCVRESMTTFYLRGW